MKVLKILAIGLITLLLVTLLYLFFNLGFYAYTQSNNRKMIQQCKKSNASFVMETGELNDPLKCYPKMFNLLLPYLLVHKVELKNDKYKLQYIKFDTDSIYIVPTFSIDKTEALIGYGVGRTCRFEDNYNRFFDKPSYAFDCGNISNICKNAHFEAECVATGKNATTYKSASDFSHPAISEDKIHQFEDKLKELKLDNSNIILKMNIVGAEDKVLDNILEYSDQIPVILLYIHIKNPKMMINKLKTLKLLNQKYVLVARSVVPVKHKAVLLDERIFPGVFANGAYTRNYSLTYINKKFIKKSYIPFNQDDTVEYINIDKFRDTYNKQHMTINWVVVLYKKLKRMFNIQ